MTGPSSVYLPILKGKQAEVLALGNVPNSKRATVLPLVEVVADDSEDPEVVEASINTLQGRLAPAWPGVDLIIDTNWVADAGALPSGQLPIERAHDLARTAGMRAIPTDVGSSCCQGRSRHRRAGWRRRLHSRSAQRL